RRGADRPLRRGLVAALVGAAARHRAGHGGSGGDLAPRREVPPVRGTAAGGAGDRRGGRGAGRLVGGRRQRRRAIGAGRRQRATFGGTRPSSSTARSASTQSIPIASRVSCVAEPRWGTRTTFSSSSRPGCTS